MGLAPPAVWRDSYYWGDLKRIDRNFAINCQLFTPTSNQGRSDDI